MFLEKQLGNGCAWINLEFGQVEKTRRPFRNLRFGQGNH